MEDRPKITQICGTSMSKGDEIKIVYRYRKEDKLALLVRPDKMAELEEFVVHDLFVRDFVYHLAVHQFGDDRCSEERLLLSVCDANTLALSEIAHLATSAFDGHCAPAGDTLEQDLKALLGDFSHEDQSGKNTILLQNTFVFRGV